MTSEEKKLVFFCFYERNCCGFAYKIMIIIFNDASPSRLLFAGNVKFYRAIARMEKKIVCIINRDANDPKMLSP